MSSSRDVEADLRDRLARDAKGYVLLLRRTLTTPDAAVDELARRSFGRAERLQDAAGLLGDGEARALLTRAIRYAVDPRSPAPARPFEPPDASRFNR